MVSMSGRSTASDWGSLLGTGEGASLFEDTYLWLAEAGRVTERVLLGPVLSVPGIRHPLVHANTLATLQRITGGRAFLGIGAGDFGRLDLGLPPATRDELIEYAATVRTLTSGEAAEVAGRSLRMQWTAGTVPVYLGADGPRALHAAGTMADGVIVGQGGHPDIVRFVQRHVEAGAAATGRTLDAVDLWFTSRIYVCDRPNGAIYVDGLDEYGARQCRYFWRTSGSPSEDDVVQRVRERKGIQLPDGSPNASWPSIGPSTTRMPGRDRRRTSNFSTRSASGSGPARCSISAGPSTTSWHGSAGCGKPGPGISWCRRSPRTGSKRRPPRPRSSSGWLHKGVGVASDEHDQRAAAMGAVSGRLGPKPTPQARRRAAWDEFQDGLPLPPGVDVERVHLGDPGIAVDRFRPEHAGPATIVYFHGGGYSAAPS